MNKIAIDTDVFLIDLWYTNDPRYDSNHNFLQKVKNKVVQGTTTIFNLLELCGKLSFNLNEYQLLNFYRGFASKYNVYVGFPILKDKTNLDMNKWVEDVYGVISRKTHLGDALIISVLEQKKIAEFVTWNTKHFQNKFIINGVIVRTPQEIICNL